jgi:hypothetical protein
VAAYQTSALGQQSLDNGGMAKHLTLPTPPASLKNWTQKDRELNDFAIRSFRNVADADYISARLAYRAQLPIQFLWASQQALEKYLKFILFLERIKVEKLGHELTPALKDHRGCWPVTRSDQEHSQIHHGHRRRRALPLHGSLLCRLVALDHLAGPRGMGAAPLLHERAASA